MSYRNFLLNLLRTRLLNQFTESVITDWATNGFTAADDVIIDAFLDTTMP